MQDLWVRPARRPLWLAGLMVLGLGFAALAIALGIGRVVVVQAPLVASIVLTLPLGYFISQKRTARIEVIGALLAVVAGFLVVASAAAASPDQELAERYAPIMMLKTNDDLPCGTGGEQYKPTSVDVTLGNPHVELERRLKGTRKEVVKRGATAVDISGLGGDYYLNQPGTPYRPRCRYARDSERLTRGLPPVTYAHIAKEDGKPGIALQYWFYYWFNRFNDLHESDWEMIQLAFDDASSIEEVLKTKPRPTRVAYAQHAGGELADWDDSKFTKVGRHPVVYPASGSHASQYESALYLGRGRHGSGLGCDDSRGPSHTVLPEPIAIPTLPVRPDQRWVTYQGHWGQRASGFSTGVGGPNMKLQWRQPFTWMQDLRHSSPRMPVSEGAGVTTTSFFCGTMTDLAGFGNFLGDRNWLVGLIVLGLLALTLIPILRTTWRPARATPLRQERAAGQLLRAAAILYRRYALSMLALVAVVLLLAIALSRTSDLIETYTGVDLNLNISDPGIDNFLTLIVFAPAYPLSLVVASSPLVALLRRIDAGERAVPWAALREIVPLIPRLFCAIGLAILAIGLMSITVILIPLAVLKAVDWTFAGQEIVFGKRNDPPRPNGLWRRFRFSVRRARDGLRASTRHVRGRWWSIAGVDLALFFVGAVLGPIVGTILILVTDAPLWSVNLIGLAVFGAALPYMTSTLTLMWLDPRRQAAKAPRAHRRRLGLARRRESRVPAEASP